MGHALILVYMTENREKKWLSILREKSCDDKMSFLAGFSWKASVDFSAVIIQKNNSSFYSQKSVFTETQSHWHRLKIWYTESYTRQRSAYQLFVNFFGKGLNVIDVCWHEKGVYIHSTNCMLCRTIHKLLYPAIIWSGGRSRAKRINKNWKKWQGHLYV